MRRALATRIQNVVDVVVFYAVVGLAVLLLSLLGGCTPPVPRTGSQCPTSETRANCGLCSSDPACGWCPSADPALRGCVDRTRPVICDEGIVRVPEACEAHPDGVLFREVT